jgi:hypothetical protein
MWEIIFVGVSVTLLTGRSDTFLINKPRANELSEMNAGVSKIWVLNGPVKFVQADRSKHSD